MGEPEIVIPELRIKVSVRELLDGVEEMSIRAEKNFLKLMIESYRCLPLLKGTGESNNQLEE